MAFKHPIVLHYEQVLKSGKLPADLDISDKDSLTTTMNTNGDKMVIEVENEGDGVMTDAINEEKNDGLTNMEHV